MNVLSGISCTSYTILWCALECNFFLLCYSYSVLWDLYAMVWEIEMKSSMIWPAVVHVYYAMLWDLSKHAQFTEEFQTLSHKIPKTQSNEYIYSLLENHHTKTQFQLCCMLLYGMLWYIMKNDNMIIFYNIYCMLWYDITML